MPRDSANEMRKAEKEIGENIPEGMKGLDTEDVGAVGARGGAAKKETSSDASTGSEPTDG